jgi:transcriptional antiterminator RfaH
MQFTTPFQWFALHTKPAAETIAAQTVSTLGLETFLPIARSVAMRRGRPVSFVRPLFPGYCFARFDAKVHLHAVRYSRGVLRVVGTGEQAWPIDEAIIYEIQSRLDENGEIELCNPSLRRGDPVRVCDGPLAGWTGVFDGELDDQLRVVIFLEAIQQTRAVISRQWVEHADAV